MPRIKEETSTLLSELMGLVERLVASARREGRHAALGEVRSLIGGATPAGAVVGRRLGRPHASRSARKIRTPAPSRPGQKRRNSWSGLSLEQRLARVNAIRKGKGLPPKELL